MKKKTKKSKAAYEAKRSFVQGSALSVLLTVLVLAILGGTWWFFDYTKDDGTLIPGAITLGLITEEEALAHLNTPQND